ncbi:hypothetical protein LK09_08520 [Microbacterium mangrovi]|uniref:Uncharacterized protein n=1 Tax=Microbacterium mangrovi TaxID=1348253 RepID=A0A0B2A727_9MICO|nr:hypothetical protein [Microbacterium mangrovi]KHK98890.1 hypothetical protein LK09_08520 [Microbacterium mangrovi]
MHWDHVFEDLEGQLAAALETEQRSLAAEQERLRIAKLSLRERLRSAADGASDLALELTDGARLSVRVLLVGEDWCAVAGEDRRTLVVPIGSIVSVGMSRADLLRTAAVTPPRGSRLVERMGAGFVLRDLARRRMPVTVHLGTGHALSGTIDRAGVDHLDLALHDPAAPRRATAVRGMRMIPLAAVAWVRLDAGDL